MTKEEAQQKLTEFILDGWDDWESTPLYTVWCNGGFPIKDDEDMEFDEALELLEEDYTSGQLKIGDLPLWCQIYLQLKTKTKQVPEVVQRTDV